LPPSKVIAVGIALAPSYASIGPAAPQLLLLFRLLQGFALGGELGASTAYLVEAAPLGRRGLYVAIQYSTQDVAVLLSGAVGYFLSRRMAAIREGYAMFSLAGVDACGGTGRQSPIEWWLFAIPGRRP